MRNLLVFNHFPDEYYKYFDRKFEGKKKYFSRCEI